MIFFCICKWNMKKKMKIRGYATNKSTFVYFLNEQVVNEVIARNMRATSFTKMWADNYRVTFCFDTPWVVVCLFYTDHWHFLTLILFLPFQNTFFYKAYHFHSMYQCQDWNLRISRFSASDEGWTLTDSEKFARCCNILVYFSQPICSTKCGKEHLGKLHKLH